MSAAKHFTYILPLINGETERVCSKDGCEKPGSYVTGYYLVVNRRVRVWTCVEHWSGNPQLVVPTPISILIAEKAEVAYHEQMVKKYRYNVAPERHESVKVLAATGIGKPLPYDRVKAWRWGE